MTRHVDVLVAGGGQAGLAAGYHLRRLGADFVVLDAAPAAGGAWQHAWDSLHLFSPAAYSSLPGHPMPAQPGMPYPDAGHVVAYLADYEKRYRLPVLHGTRVHAVRRDGPYLRAETDVGAWQARAVISATGTWSRPFLPGWAGSPGARRASCPMTSTAGPCSMSPLPGKPCARSPTCCADPRRDRPSAGCRQP
jgi:putative flavoprotein involved in K+ transport